MRQDSLVLEPQPDSVERYHDDRLLPVAELEFAVVETLASFEALRPEWDALTDAAAGPADVFCQHSWVWHWWQSYFDGSWQPAVVVGRRNGRLEFVLALSVETKLGVRTLSAMGDPVSQYSNVVCNADAVSIEEIVKGLQFAGEFCEADVFSFNKVREDSMLAGALASAGGRITEEQLAPVIRTSDHSSVHDIEGKFSSKMRRNRRRKRKKLVGTGQLGFQILSEGPEALVAVERALAFKSEWLDHYAIVSNAYADERFSQFWRSVADTPERPVGLAACVLDLDGRPIAIEVGLRYKGAHCAHIGAFDIEVEKGSPGAAQMDAVLEACIADGIEAYDMLAPNADYKERLADDFIVVRNYVLARSAKGRACDALRLTESRGMAKAAVKSLPASVRKVIKSTLGF